LVTSSSPGRSCQPCARREARGWSRCPQAQHDSARSGGTKGIRAFAAHPGVVIGPGPFAPERAASYRRQGLIDAEGATIIDPEAGKKTIEQGAATLVFGAASPLLDGHGGVYLKDCDIAVLDDEPRPLTADSLPSDANSAMLDPHDAHRLWELTEQTLTGAGAALPSARHD
jgi:hypothetical protein